MLSRILMLCVGYVAKVTDMLWIIKVEKRPTAWEMCVLKCNLYVDLSSHETVLISCLMLTDICEQINQQAIG